MILSNFQRGIVHTDEEGYFIIHPLPKRFHNETSKPHILVRKPHKINYELENCPHNIIHREHDNNDTQNAVQSKLKLPDSYKTKENFTKAMGNIGKSPSTKRAKRDATASGSPVFVETAVFVDRDLFDHMKTNFPMETERELIRFVLAMINAVS